jgi:hypothetical protein
MSENTQPLTVMTKTPGHRFEIGHPRWGGKRRNSSQLVRDLCEEMDVNPMRFMLAIIKDGWCSQVVIEDGKKKRVEVVASLEMRADLAKYVSRFVFPVLSASEISGPDEGPIELARVNTELERAMSTPGGVEIIQRAALLMAAQDAPQAPTPRVIPPGDTYQDR